jgi:hypothetical protein
MARQTHTIPTTWGEEVLKANNNATELYTEVGTLKTKAVPMTGAGASTAGAVGLVPAPVAGEQNKVLSGAGTWVEPPVSSPVSGTVYEVGTIEVGTTAANAASLILGGLEFRWSQASAGGGVIHINQAPGITQGSVAGTAVVISYTNGNRTESSATSPTIWGSDASNIPISSAHVITAPGQHLEHHLMTRNRAKNSVWDVKVFWTAQPSLLITGTYIGPKIV